jgi:hypothetical protein
MSYDYLDDQFGQFRTTPNKFSAVEDQAINLLRQYADAQISSDEFGDGFMQVSQDFKNLMKDESGSYVFSEETPSWLNLFIGNKFVNWNKLRLTVNAAREKPELASNPRWPMVMNMVANEDATFMEAIKYCLKKLGKAAKQKK